MNSWFSFANKHLALVFTIIVVWGMVIICFCIFFHAEHWKNVQDNHTFSVQTNMSNEEYKSDIQIKDEKKYFVLSGFCYKLNERVKKFDISVALKENGTDKYILIPTHLVIRNDLSCKENVTEKQGNFAMYDASGFETRIRKTRLLHHNEYKVYILYKSNNENTLIDTGKSIYYE